MTTLTAVAVISAVDRASAVFGRVAAAARSAAGTYGHATGRMQRANERMGRVVTTGFALPAAAGITALIARTQEFEKRVVGLQIAGITDNLQNGVVNFEKLRSEAEATKREALGISKALSVSPTLLIAASEAALKMGLSQEKVSKLTQMSGSVHIQDPQISPEKATEFLGSMGILFNAGTDGRDYNKDIERIANQWLLTANATRTTASRLEEGLRQFAPLFASFGESFHSTAALVGAMVQAGQTDVESGTALKSLGVRMLKPPADAREAMLLAGIDRGKFMDLQAVSVSKAFSSLKKLTDVKLSGQQKDSLFKLLKEGGDNKLFGDTEYVNRLAANYNEMTGAKTQEARDRNMERILMSVTAGGGRIKMFELIKELAQKLEKGELTDQQMAMIGDGRHLSRYKALFKLIKFLDELKGKLSAVNDEVTTTGNKLWKESSAGKWEGAVAALDRAFIRLRESPAIIGAMEGFERLATVVAELPPHFVQLAGGVMIAGLGIASVGTALNGLAAIAARPLLFAGIGAAAFAAYEIYQNWDRLKQLAADPVKFEVLFPEAPDWLKWLMRGPAEAAAKQEEAARLDAEGKTLSARASKFFKWVFDPGWTFGNDFNQPGFRPKDYRVGPYGLPPLSTLDPIGRLPMFAQPSLLDLSIMKDMKVQADVQGEVAGRVELNATIKVDGPGQVVNQSSSGGDIRGKLNTGKSMPDTGAGK